MDYIADRVDETSRSFSGAGGTGAQLLHLIFFMGCKK